MRYLPPSDFICDNVTKQLNPRNGKASVVTDIVTRHTSIGDNLSRVTQDKLSVTTCVTAQTTNDVACHAVTDEMAFSWQGINTSINDENTEWF